MTGVIFLTEVLRGDCRTGKNSSQVFLRIADKVIVGREGIIGKPNYRNDNSQPGT